MFSQNMFILLPPLFLKIIFIPPEIINTYAVFFKVLFVVLNDFLGKINEFLGKKYLRMKKLPFDIQISPPPIVENSEYNKPLFIKINVGVCVLN